MFCVLILFGMGAIFLESLAHLLGLLGYAFERLDVLKIIQRITQDDPLRVDGTYISSSPPPPPFILPTFLIPLQLFLHSPN